MRQILYVFVNFVYYFVVVLQMLMFIRGIMSWIITDEENTFTRFVNVVTEPVIVPVRMILERFESIRNMPIDISFFVAFMLLVIIQNVLPGVSL